MSSHGLVELFKPREVFLLRYMVPYLVVSIGRMLIVWQISVRFPSLHTMDFLRDVYTFYGITAILFTMSWALFLRAQIIREEIMRQVLEMAIQIHRMTSEVKLDFNATIQSVNPRPTDPVAVVLDTMAVDEDDAADRRASCPCPVTCCSRVVADAHATGLVTNMSPFSTYIQKITLLIHDAPTASAGINDTRTFNAAIKDVVNAARTSQRADVTVFRAIDDAAREVARSEDAILFRLASPSILVSEGMVGVMMVGYFAYLPIFASISYGGEGAVLVLSLTFVVLAPFITSRILRNPFGDMRASVPDEAVGVITAISIEGRIVGALWNTFVLLWNAVVTQLCTCPRGTTVGTLCCGRKRQPYDAIDTSSGN
jgi:hypothetical protein